MLVQTIIKIKSNISIIDISAKLKCTLGSLLLISLTLVTPLASAYDRVTGKAFASRSEVIAQHGMAPQVNL